MQLYEDYRGGNFNTNERINLTHKFSSLEKKKLVIVTITISKRHRAAASRRSRRYPRPG
jgi:hypothetical protein